MWFVATLTDLLSPWFPGDRSLQQMLSSVDRMFDEMMAPAWQGWRQPGLLGPRGLGAELGALAVRPPWDVQEDQAAYHIRFDLPGMGLQLPCPARSRDSWLLGARMYGVVSLYKICTCKLQYCSLVYGTGHF